jgi:hypothetical protein
MLAALAAAIAPVVAAVNGKYQTDRELSLKAAEQKSAAELAAQRFKEDVRSRYLDRMKDETERQRTLRFLIATSPEESIRLWAEKEKSLVDAEVDSLKTQISKLEEEKSVATAELTEALSKKQSSVPIFRKRIFDISTEKANLEARLKSQTSTTAGRIGLASTVRTPRDSQCVAICMKDWGWSGERPADIQAELLETQCREICRDAGQ